MQPERGVSVFQEDISHEESSTTASPPAAASRQKSCTLTCKARKHMSAVSPFTLLLLRSERWPWLVREQIIGSLKSGINTLDCLLMKVFFLSFYSAHGCSLSLSFPLLFNLHRSFTDSFSRTPPLPPHPCRCPPPPLYPPMHNSPCQGATNSFCSPAFSLVLSTLLSFTFQFSCLKGTMYSHPTPHL